MGGDRVWPDTEPGDGATIERADRCGRRHPDASRVTSGRQGMTTATSGVAALAPAALTARTRT